MAVYTTNLVIYTGTDVDQVFVLADDASESLLNLTGYSAICKIKKHGNSASTTAEFTTSFTDVTGGKVKISLSAAQTAALKPGRYYYDLLLYYNGENSRAVEGEIIVKKSVTRF